MVQLRTALAKDLEAMLSVARRLPAWFNDGGLAEMTKDFPQHSAIVASEPRGDQEEIIGFVTWAPSPHTPEDYLLEMTWLGVLPEWQRHGVGARMVKGMEEECRRLGIAVIQVSTLADSVDYEPYARTRAFYRSLGFVDWRVDSGFYDGDDRLLLRKPLLYRTGG